MSAPRRTQSVPMIVVTPPDDEQVIEQSRQPFFPQRLTQQQPRVAGPRPIQPCPVSNETVARPRATTELVRPVAVRPTARMTLPMFAMSQQGSSQVSQQAIVARFAHLGDRRDVERAVAELTRRGANIGEQLVSRLVESCKNQRQQAEGRWAKQLVEVEQGTYGLDRVAHPTAKDTTQQAAQRRYDADQAELVKYAEALRQRAGKRTENF